MNRFFVRSAGDSVCTLGASTNRREGITELLTHGTEAIRNMNVSSVLIPRSLGKCVLIRSSAGVSLEGPSLGMRRLEKIIKNGTAVAFRRMGEFLGPRPVVSSVRGKDVIRLVSNPFGKRETGIIHVSRSHRRIILRLVRTTMPVPIAIGTSRVEVVRGRTS